MLWCLLPPSTTLLGLNSRVLLKLKLKLYYNKFGKLDNTIISANQTHSCLTAIKCYAIKDTKKNYTRREGA
jgi:hypothetical protein